MVFLYVRCARLACTDDCNQNKPCVQNRTKFKFRYHTQVHSENKMREPTMLNQQHVKQHMPRPNTHSTNRSRGTFPVVLDVVSNVLLRKSSSFCTPASNLRLICHGFPPCHGSNGLFCFKLKNTVFRHDESFPNLSDIQQTKTSNNSKNCFYTRYAAEARTREQKIIITKLKRTVPLNNNPNNTL